MLETPDTVRVHYSKLIQKQYGVGITKMRVILEGPKAYIGANFA